MKNNDAEDSTSCFLDVASVVASPTRTCDLPQQVDDTIFDQDCSDYITFAILIWHKYLSHRLANHYPAIDIIHPQRAFQALFYIVRKAYDGCHDTRRGGEAD